MVKRCNTLFFKIILVVLTGIVCLTTGLSILNIRASQQAFVENFVESQDKIFQQTDRNIYNFFRDMTAVTSSISTSSTVEKYLTETDWEYTEEAKNILDLKQYLKQLPIEKYSDMNLVLLGIDGKTLNYNDSSLVMDGETLLHNYVVKKALENPKKLICQYEEGGYTDVMKDYPVIVLAKSISRNGGKNVCGITLLTIKEADFRRYYDGFTTSTNDLLILNQDNEIISSNREEYLKDSGDTRKLFKIIKEMEKAHIKTMNREENGQITGYMVQRLQSTNYTMLGMIHPDMAFDRVYDFRYIISVTAFITSIVVIIIFLLVRQQTRPLYKLVEKMRGVREGRLNQFVKVEGSTEIRELSFTYNTMLDEMQQYIDKLMEVEKAKREAEIHSLQMQINPHYIYNTLASVKWLIWQGNKEKSVQVIDAFIRLLRNTISNKKEFITLKEEIENLKDYVIINQTRYGNSVNVEYYVLPDCEEQKIPKLILQPFVENAFFHAFPQGQQGTISIFARMSEGQLKIEIIDDGIGMDNQTVRTLLDKSEGQKEHFTGIGVNNVDDRMKLIYGQNYGILIESKRGEGTKITLCFPENKEE